MNMGTPGHPEGIEHWSNKTIYSHKLESRRRRQQAFWLFFRECCGECEDIGYVENILSGVTSVKMEADYGNFRPDILLERRNKPPLFLEFTHTHPPSQRKLAYCSKHGIDIFELEGSQRPINSTVRKAHISHQNCRNRQRRRLFDLWQHMASQDDPIVGIKEDFRSHERQQQEQHAFWSEFEVRRQEVASGTLRCARCDTPFAIIDGGFRLSSIDTHRPDGLCGEIHLCEECEFAIRGGWNGVYPEDAGSWGLVEGCPTCQPIIAQQERELSEGKPRRSVSMPESYGHRLVWEPERRRQAYIVGNQSVTRDEMQSILMMFQLVLTGVLSDWNYSAVMQKEVRRIGAAVLYANNIRDWDWLDGIGESYVPDHDYPDGFGGNSYLYPKRWWQELPPCPLTIV